MANFEIVIKPKQKWHLLDLSELLHYRELFYIFTWRDIKVRYKQTVLGVMWVAFQPLVTSFIFTIFFGKLAKIPTGNLPYELFVFIGLIFWTFFSNSVSSASNSLIENVQIIKKVYFPREILPISATLTSLVDFGVNVIILILFGLYFKIIPHPIFLITLPIAILLTLITASGLGLLLASFNVKYRDVRYILPFFIQVMLFLTPVIYPSSAIRDSLRWIVLLNPMSGAIEIMRASYSPNPIIEPAIIIFSFFAAILIFILGLLYFRSTERFFADIA